MIKGITKSKNLYDIDAHDTSNGYVTNYYLLNDGTTSYGTSHEITEYIEIEAETQYALGGVGSYNAPSICFYDVNKQFISGVSYSGRSKFAVMSPSTAAYVRFTHPKAATTTMMVKGSDTPAIYEPYGDIPKDITRIAMKGKNLCPTQPYKNGKYINASGQENDLATFCIFSFPSEPNATYTVSCNTSLGGYQVRIHAFSNSEWVEQITDFGSTTFPKTFTSPSTCDEIRISIPNASIGHLMVVSGSTPLPYEPYGMQPGWEVRDQQGTILWAADKTLTGTDSIPIKGYGLPLTDYKVEADMTVPATQEYSIEGTSSIDYQSDGTALTDLEFQGNMVQSGTPSSSSPIYPSEMGERTGNLFDSKTVYATYVQPNGDISATSSQFNAVKNYFTADMIGKTITISVKFVSIESSQAKLQASIDGTTSTVSMNAGESGVLYLTVVPTSTDDYFRISYGTGTFDITISEFMVSESSGYVPYEPYGYKIPFSNGNTTYNVYLSEPLRKIGDYGDSVASDGTVVRRIKKLVLTGTESWMLETGNTYYTTIPMPVSGYANTMCTHYPIATSYTDLTSTDLTFSVSRRPAAFIHDNRFSDRNELKAFLASEYSAGHPVEVWYVLATETSESVTFPTVTPAQGANTLSVNTTLAPSKTRLTATSGVWPKNPIWPAEFGEPTVNLLDFTTVQNSTNASATVNSDGVTISGKYFVKFTSVQFTIGQTYSMSWEATTISGDPDLYWRFHYADDTYSYSKRSGTSETVEKEVSELLLYVNMTSAASASAKLSNLMLNTGQTPLPYEPYGQFKIPITCGGNTYNVFTTAPLRKIGSYADYEQLSVGEGRKIGKLVLDGNSDIYSYTSGASGIGFRTGTISDMLTNAREKGRSTHFKAAAIPGSATDDIVTFGVANKIIYFVFSAATASALNLSDLTSIQAWLAAQKTAGTPVTVWYVQETPTVAPTQLPTITPTDGNDTFAVNTTVPPSAVTITGHVKARGV